VDRCANDSRATLRREFFCQILLPLLGERYVKKPKFNNARAIIVVAQQNSWRLADSRAKDVRAVSPTWIFATFLLRGEASVALRREMSGARTSSLNVPLLSRCSSVVRWAVPQTAKVQQCTCHYCPIYCPSRANSWAISGLLRQRLSSCASTWIFGKFCCRREVGGTRKSQNSTMHLPLLSQPSKKRWATCCHLAS